MLEEFSKKAAAEKVQSQEPRDLYSRVVIAIHSLCNPSLPPHALKDHVILLIKVLKTIRYDDECDIFPTLV